MISVFKSLSIQFVCLLIILGAIEGTDLDNKLQPGYTYHDEIKSAYKLHTAKLSWSDAQTICEYEGARLAVLDTWQKVRYVTPVIQRGLLAWIGIVRDSSLASPWEAVDGGLVSTHLPWKPLGYLPLLGDCLTFGVGMTEGLTNRFCWMEKMFVCEIPGER